MEKGDSDDGFLLVINTDNFVLNSWKVSPARPQPGQPKPLRDLESSYQSHRRTFKSPKNQFTVSRSPHFESFFLSISVEDMDGYFQYIGGSTGALAIGIAAASAIYLATRPTPEEPLVPLHDQSPVLEVSSARL